MNNKKKKRMEDNYLKYVKIMKLVKTFLTIITEIITIIMKIINNYYYLLFSYYYLIGKIINENFTILTPGIELATLNWTVEHFTTWLNRLYYLLFLIFFIIMTILLCIIETEAQKIILIDLMYKKCIINNSNKWLDSQRTEIV